MALINQQKYIIENKRIKPLYLNNQKNTNYEHIFKSTLNQLKATYY